jgi:hypothetical protein
MRRRAGHRSSVGLEDGALRMQDLLSELTIQIVEESELTAFGEADRLLANVNYAGGPRRARIAAEPLNCNRIKT